jgi:SPP1 family predicted phage head-tail adaptor
MAMDEELSGSLDEQVVLERWQSARDDAGDDAGAWVTVDRLFASVQPLGPLAAARGGDAARSGRRWRVVLRHRDDVSLSSRLLWRGQLLRVRAIADPGRRRDRLELLCEGQPA